MQYSPRLVLDTSADMLVTVIIMRGAPDGSSAIMRCCILRKKESAAEVYAEHTVKAFLRHLKQVGTNSRRNACVVDRTSRRP